MDVKHIANDVHNCLKNISSFTQNQALVSNWDSDFLKYITIQIQPNSGPYCGGKYTFEIFFHEMYPNTPPEVRCLTNIYHPNIDVYDRAVCLNMLEEEWESHFGLEDIIQGLMFLLNYPNLEDPLSCWFDPSMDEESFHAKVKQTLLGKGIDDDESIKFDSITDAASKNISTQELDQPSATVKPKIATLNCEQLCDGTNETELVHEKNPKKVECVHTETCGSGQNEMCASMLYSCETHAQQKGKDAYGYTYASNCNEFHNEIADGINRKFIDEGFQMLLNIDIEGLYS